jgi:hypothetical protein
MTEFQETKALTEAIQTTVAHHSNQNVMCALTIALADLITQSPNPEEYFATFMNMLMLCLNEYGDMHEAGMLEPVVKVN